MGEYYSKFIEAFVPGDACNLHCKYCYVAQGNKRNNDVCQFYYSPNVIGTALKKERVGGVAYINICGAGETLIPKQMPEIVCEILKQGHFVNIYTNGTMSARFDELLSVIPESLYKYLSISFSIIFIPF